MALTAARPRARSRSERRLCLWARAQMKDTANMNVDRSLPTRKAMVKKDVFDIYTLIFLALAMFIVLWLRSILPLAAATNG